MYTVGAGDRTAFNLLAVKGWLALPTETIFSTVNALSSRDKWNLTQQTSSNYVLITRFYKLEFFIRWTLFDFNVDIYVKCIQTAPMELTMDV